MRGLILILCALFLGFSSLAQTWVPTSLIPNYQVNDFLIHKEKLYIAGHFETMNGLEVNSVVAWDGDSLFPLKSGLWGGLDYAAKIIPWGDSLVAMGNFIYADSIFSPDIAIWNGNDWVGINNQLVQVGNVLDAAIYKGELYAAGSFDSIGGIKSSHIAKWDGSQWSQVGQGLIGRSVNDLQVYKGDLYATGSFDSVATGPAPYIARWDGQQWHSLGNSENIGGSGLGIWNDKLLISERFNHPRPGEYYSIIYSWDGVQFEQFYERFGSFRYTSFYSFRNELFAVELYGSNRHPGVSLVYVWNEAREEFLQYGRGINRDPTCMAEFQGEIYLGGLFHTNNGAVADFIAKLELPPKGNQLKQLNEIVVFPNPSKSGIFHLSLPENGLKKILVEVKDSKGQTLVKKDFVVNEHNKYELDLSRESEGVYFASIYFNDSDPILIKLVIVK